MYALKEESAFPQIIVKAGRLAIERRVGFGREPRVDLTYPLESIRAVQLLFTGSIA